MTKHRSPPIVRLQETRTIQIFCSRFCEQASICSPPGNHLCPTFFFDRGIYDAAIILGRIQGGTEPTWSRFFVRVLRLGMEGNSLAFYLPPSIGLLKLHFRKPITLELHERARWLECYLDYGLGSFVLLHLKRVCFCVLCVFFLLVFFCFFCLVLFFSSSLRTNITHHMH